MVLLVIHDDKQKFIIITGYYIHLRFRYIKTKIESLSPWKIGQGREGKTRIDIDIESQDVKICHTPLTIIL